MGFQNWVAALTCGFMPLCRIGCHRVAAATVRRVLRRFGLPPAPQRASQQTWRSFLHTQAHTLLACDVMHVETVFLKRLYVFFVMEMTPALRLPNPSSVQVTRHVCTRGGCRQGGCGVVCRGGLVCRDG